MALALHVWKITGVSPLLQNNPATMSGGGGDGKSLTAGKTVYDDKEEAAIRVYKNSDGLFVHPTAAFRSGILAASSGRTVQNPSGGKRKVAARGVLAGSVFPAEVEAILLDDKGKPIKKYEIYKCRVVVNKHGVLRCRPMYWPWSLLLPIEIDTDFMNPDVVTEILNISGRIIGVGDNRPDTSKGKAGVGTFGRYSAKLN